MSLQYIKKEVRDEVDFLHADECKNFLQVDSSTLGIKVFYKMMRSLLMGMIYYSQSTQSNKFAISLQYLKKEVRNGVFDGSSQTRWKYTENRKLVNFLQYTKKKVMQLLLCSIVMQNIQILNGVPVMFVIVFEWSFSKMSVAF